MLHKTLNYKIPIFLLMISISLISCEKDCTLCSTPAVDENVSIYAILDASSNYQRSIVARIMDNQYTGEIFINDLDVQINGVGLSSKPNTATFLERRYFDYEEDANYLGSVDILSQDSATVQVFDNGNLLAQGYTKVPEPFIVVLNIATQVLQWTKNATDRSVLGEYYYEDTDLVRMYSVSVSKRIGAGTYETLLENEYVFDNEYILNDSLFFLQGYYRYRVTAYDLNFYKSTVLDSTSEGLDLGEGLIASKRSEVFDHFPPKDIQ